MYCILYSNNGGSVETKVLILNCEIERWGLIFFCFFFFVLHGRKKAFGEFYVFSEEKERNWKLPVISKGT